MRPSDASLAQVYGAKKLRSQQERYDHLSSLFSRHFPAQGAPRFFSAPGRAEIGGNHTDHQAGRVLTAAISMDSIAAAQRNDLPIIRIHSEGYPAFDVNLEDLSARKAEQGTTAALVRGVAARMHQLGHPVGGFDAAVTSTVLGGSGLSSSAAFEVLMVTVLDGLFGDGQMPSKQRAKISQYAENEYFGKPSGLLDQMGSATGGIVSIDFRTPDPAVSDLSYNFEAKGYRLAVVDTKGSHDDLTDEYAAIRREMEQVAAFFGQKQLAFVDPVAFDDAIPGLRKEVSDRALLRSMHFFDEDARVPQMVHALEENDLPTFFQRIIDSGNSSWQLLQNVWADPKAQPLALALALTRRMLEGDGAWRVHGGGFAGTILAFVPTGKYEAYAARMNAVFGEGAACALDIRNVGGVELLA